LTSILGRWTSRLKPGSLAAKNVEIVPFAVLASRVRGITRVRPALRLKSVDVQRESAGRQTAPSAAPKSLSRSHHDLGAQREYCPALLLKSLDVQRGVRWTSECAVMPDRRVFHVQRSPSCSVFENLQQRMFPKRLWQLPSKCSRTLSSRFQTRSLLSAGVCA
jgi:hypothetical protein